MSDVMEQLRAAQPMPRGERLDRARYGRGWANEHRLVKRSHNGLMRAWINDTISEYAAPLALERERRRMARAEARVKELHAALFKAWADEQATSAAFHERGREIDALNVEHERLRTEVEAMRAGHTCREGDRVDCLACDKNMRELYLPGATPQPPPVSSERSRDVLPRAVEYARYMHAGLSTFGVAPQHEEMLDTIDHALHMLGVDVAAALEARAAAGLKKYGVPLRTFNGRKAREDLAQELLDAFMYAVQRLMEQEG